MAKLGGVPAWTVAKNVPNPNITYSGKDESLIRVFRAVLSLSNTKEGPQHTIVPGLPSDKPIDMEFKDVPLGEAIAALFKDTGVSYTIDANIQELKVTAVLKNVTLDQALKGVLRAAGGVYRVENGMYIISARPAVSPEPVGQPSAILGPPGAAPGMASQPGGDVVTQIVGLNYVSAGDVAPMIAGRGVTVSTTNGNKLILTGSSQAVNQVMALIRAVDDETALARTIRLKMTAKVTVQTAKGPKTYDASTESIGAEQTPSLLNLQTQMPYYTEYSAVAKDGKTVKQRQPNFQQAKLVDATIVPTMTADGRIGLAGRGHFSFILGTPPGTEISKDFDIAASAEPGKPTVVAAGSATLDVGKVEFSVSVTATPEAGRVHFAPPQGSPTPGMQPGAYGGGYGGRGGWNDDNYGRSYGQPSAGGGGRSW